MEERVLPPDLDVIHESDFLSAEEITELKAYLMSDEVLWNRPSKND
jgi:hypothetical protein